MTNAITLDAFEALARECAADEVTLRANREAYAFAFADEAADGVARATAILREASTWRGLSAGEGQPEMRGLSYIGSVSGG